MKLLGKILCLSCLTASLFISGCTEKEAPKTKPNFIHPSKIPAPAGKPEDSQLTTAPSGFKYRVLRAGTGKSPQATDQVEVHYRGNLVDGKEFDSSYKRGNSTTFRVNQVIKGWTQALQMMKEGGRWQIVVPPHLGYGAMGAGNIIPPNATLIFEIELIKVIK